MIKLIPHQAQLARCRLPAEPPIQQYIVRSKIVIAVLFGGFGLWAAFASLTSAAVAPGVVKVDSYRKTVQHLEGGIVSEILVHEGDTVAQGQALIGYSAQNANQPWSLTAPDSSTLRFELRQQDHWAGDYSASVQRTEIAQEKLYPAGTLMEITYDFKIEPGPSSISRFTVLGQLHAESDGPGPYFVQLMPGDYMKVTLGNGTLTNHSNIWDAYVDPNPLVRGHTYSMKIDVNLSKDSSGYVHVWRDGVEIVNYNGPLGYGDATYWKEGIYRENSPETMAVDYFNLKIVTPTSTDILRLGADPTQSDPGTGTSPGNTDTGTGFGASAGDCTGHCGASINSS